MHKSTKKMRWTWETCSSYGYTDANLKMALTWSPEGKRGRQRPRDRGGEQLAKKKERWGGIPDARQSTELKTERAGVAALQVCALRHEKEDR